MDVDNPSILADRTNKTEKKARYRGLKKLSSSSSSSSSFFQLGELNNLDFDNNAIKKDR